MFRKSVLAFLLCLVTGLIGLGFVFAEENPKGPVQVSQAQFTPLNVGASKLEITLDPTRRRLTMTGYGDREGRAVTGVLDPLYLRTVVIEDANGHLLGIVSADLCYLHSEIHEAVLAKVTHLGFDESNLILAATHNHSGFGGYDRRYISKKVFGKYDPVVSKFLVTKIVSALETAKRNMKPAWMEAGHSTVSGMNRSRLDPAFDIQVGGKSTVKPDPVKFPVDKRLTVIRFMGKEQKVIALIYHFSAHPTILSPKNMALSGDWPGVTSRTLEGRNDENGPALFLNGTLGDSAPTPDWNEDLVTEIKMSRKFGLEMAENIACTIPSLAVEYHPEISTASAGQPFERIVVRPAGQMKLPGFMTGLIQKRAEMVFVTAKLGKLLLMTVPGEPTTAVGNELRSLWPDPQNCLIVAPANGYRAYFVTPDQYDYGTYAADSCLYGKNTLFGLKAGMKKALDQLQEKEDDE